MAQNGHFCSQQLFGEMFKITIESGISLCPISAKIMIFSIRNLKSSASYLYQKGGFLNWKRFHENAKR
jgi:hypothetical protein